MRVTILGVPIDAVTGPQALKFVTDAVNSGRRGLFVATPNPEMLVAAQKNANFRAILGKADLNIPDGAGLLWAARWQGDKLKERVTGADFMQWLVAWAADHAKSVYLLGGIEADTAERAAAELKRHHPGLAIAGARSGGRVRRDQSGILRIDEATMSEVRDSRPDILFVAFGHGRQEEWIVQHLPELPDTAVAVGIGGTFDFIAGRAKRAPAPLRRLGLEWLWRLVREPRRWRRIWNAVAVFPYLVISERH